MQQFIRNFLVALVVLVQGSCLVASAFESGPSRQTEQATEGFDSWDKLASTVCLATLPAVLLGCAWNSARTTERVIGRNGLQRILVGSFLFDEAMASQAKRQLLLADIGYATVIVGCSTAILTMYAYMCQRQKKQVQ